MPTTTIPLVFQPTQRGPLINSQAAPTKDARMVRCFSTIHPNKVTRQNALYCEKIPGWVINTTPNPSVPGSALYFSPTGTQYSAFGASTSTVYADSGNIGAVTSGLVTRFDAGSLSGAENIFWLTDSGSGWYYPDSSSNTTVTYTADGNNSTTITDIKISGVNSTAGLYPGQKLSAASNIVAGTRIVSVNSGAFTAVLDTATTGGAFNDLSITKEKIALMNDTDFTAMLHTGGFAEMDGYVFCAVTQTSGTTAVAHSDLNSASAWNPLNVVVPHHYDEPVGTEKYRDHIVYLGSDSLQFFYNAGNPSGSVLAQNDNLSIIGLGLAGRGYQYTANIGGTIYFPGVTDGVLSGIYRLNGFQPENIAPPSITRHLQKIISVIGGSSLLVAFDAFSIFGMNYLYIAGGALQFLYCVDTDTWTEAGFFTGGVRISGGRYSVNHGEIFMLEMTGGSGIIYKMGTGNIVYQDNGSTYTMTLQTEPYVLNDGKGFVINSVELLADTQASGSTAFYTTTDDYANWVTQPSFDMTLTTKEVHRLGLYRNHVAFKLEHSANTAWRAQALKVRWEPCST